MHFEVKIFVYLICCTSLCAGSVSSTVSALKPVLSLYRYEGNFYPIRTSRNVNQEAVQDEVTPRYINQVELSNQIYHNENERISPALSRQHQMPIKLHPRLSERSSANLVPTEGNLKATEVYPNKEIRDVEGNKVVPINSVIRNYHDIFVKYKSPQELVFGHVLSWPGTAEKKIEKRTGNTYKGQVIWADKKGGYGEHYWDLAQGAL